MNNIAIITARGGSKRIPKKNIRQFKGKPIIAYSIETAINSGLFKTILVSTDDEEIAAIATRYGAEVPFFRSKEASNDYSTTADVLLEVISILKHSGKNFANVCCIYPTAPFVTVENLKKAYELLIKNNFTTVFPVCAFNYPVLRSLQISDNDKVEMVWPENINTRSQDLPHFFHDAGQFYWLKPEEFLISKKLFTDNSGSIVLDEMQVQDIDNESDWKWAELKYSILYPGA